MHLQKKDKGAKAYQVNEKDDGLWKENRWVVALLLLRCESSTTTVLGAEDYKKLRLWEKMGKDMDSKWQKNEREGKISHFISPRKIESRSLGHD